MNRAACLACATTVAATLLLGCGGNDFEASSGGNVDGGSDTGGDVAAGETGGDVAADTAAAALEVTPSSHTFDDVPVGTTSAPFSFVVTNQSQETVEAVSGEIADSAFAIENTTCGTLAPSATCSIDVTFTPPTSQPVDATLVVSSAGASLAQAAVHGIPVASQAGLAVEPPVVDFELVPIGTLATQTLTIRNLGDEDLSEVQVSVVTNQGAAVFSIANDGCGGPLPAHENCTVEVAFEPVPSEPGKKSAELHVEGQPGSVSATADLLGHTADCFVRPGGDDGHDGLSAGSAFATVGRALDLAQGPDWTVHLLSGTFGQQETFPLVVQGSRVVGEGNPPPKITVPSPPPDTVIEMSGEYPELHGFVIDVPMPNGGAPPTVIAMKPSVDAVLGEMRIQMQGGWTGVDATLENEAQVDVFATTVRCAGSVSSSQGVLVAGKANATFEGLSVDGCMRGLRIEGQTATLLWGSTFHDIQAEAVLVFSGDATLDMGQSTAAPGNNVFAVDQGANFVALKVAAGNTIWTRGNTWIPNVQNADSQGQYAENMTISGPKIPDKHPANFDLADESELLF